MLIDYISLEVDANFTYVRPLGMMLNIILINNIHLSSNVTPDLMDLVLVPQSRICLRFS